MSCSIKNKSVSFFLIIAIVGINVLTAICVLVFILPISTTDSTFGTPTKITVYRGETVVELTESDKLHHEILNSLSSDFSSIAIFREVSGELITLDQSAEELLYVTFQYENPHSLHIVTEAGKVNLPVSSIRFTLTGVNHGTFWIESKTDKLILGTLPINPNLISVCKQALP